ncbi:MAG: hypothetical protein LBD81_02140 [Holosporaceae bacterium]|jgi:hypothetical protein|nr:hypothetical protein [Holosporaceae bacterium]
MSFFSSAVELFSIKRKQGRQNDYDPAMESSNPIDSDEEVFANSELTPDLDFPIRDYLKESFSVLIVKPMSGCMGKIIRGISFVVTGVLCGSAAAVIICCVLMQFGSVENSLIGTIISHPFERMFPDLDISIRSAMFQWNSEHNTFEISLKKVRADDVVIPRVSIIPNYLESIRQLKFVPGIVSIVNARINAFISDDYKSLFVRSNMETSTENSAYFDPIAAIDGINAVLDRNTVIKLVNANVSITDKENTAWNLKNFYCEYTASAMLPKVLSFSSVMPGTEHSTTVKMHKVLENNKTFYDITLDSMNPFSIYSAFASKNTPFNDFVSLLEGYDLPISGTLRLKYHRGHLSSCKFDLTASVGTVRLLGQNSLALTLGKKIDNGSISGTIKPNRVDIDALDVSYGDSGVKLTNINMPLKNFLPESYGDINGSLSVTNIGMQGMETILPENISKTVVPTFKNCLPGFRLESFKVDLNGPISFGKETPKDQLAVGHGMFKISDARIPIGNDTITNIDAVGTVTDDGLDIKLLNAKLKNTSVNGGAFFLSNKDNSWNGKVNVALPLNDISNYASKVSNKLSGLPLDKLNIKGVANLDMKLVRLDSDEKIKDGSPFRIVECEGELCSTDNKKKISICWDDHNMTLKGDVNSENDNSIKINIKENLTAKTGTANFELDCTSDFLHMLLPMAPKWISGSVALRIDNSWDKRKEVFDIIADLRGTSIDIPIIGNVKLPTDDGIFKVTITKTGNLLNFSNLVLETNNTKISGKMVTNLSGDIIKCSLNTFNINGCSARLSMSRENDSGYLLSLLGDSIDMSRLSSIHEMQNKSLSSLFAYVDLREIVLSPYRKLKNIKGNIRICNGNIVGGECIALYGNAATLALSAKPTEGSSDGVVMISASDAGELMKYLGVSDCMSGGTLNASFKSSDKSTFMSGGFEMNNFLVTNSDTLKKLISLSSPNLVPGKDLSLGCNSFIGHLIASKDKLEIKNGRILSPIMSFTVDATYNRRKDEINATGLSLPMSSIINSRNGKGAFVGEYSGAGRLSSPSIAVKTLKFMEYSAIENIFGKMLPTLEPSSEIDNEYVRQASEEDEKAAAKPKRVVQIEAEEDDPFITEVFDAPLGKNLDDDETVSTTTTTPHKQHIRTRTVDKKTGVIINRGSKNNAN